MNEERSDVYCTNCARTFIATLDLGLNGNHEITCPHCRHVHYRVVKNGVITEDRWRSSAGPTYVASISTTITVTSGTTSTFTALWLNGSDLVLT